MSVKRSKSLKPSKSAKSEKLPINQVSDSPLTPLSKVDSCPTIPQNGGNGNNGNTPPTTQEITQEITPELNNPVIPWSIEEALTLRRKDNMTYQEIADHYAIPWSTLYKRMHKFMGLMTGEELQAFRGAEADIVDSTKAMLLCQLSDKDKLKEASINNAGYVWDKLATHSRLIADKSTANVEIHISDDMSDHIDDVAISYSDKLLADATDCEGVSGDTD